MHHEVFTENCVVKGLSTGVEELTGLHPYSRAVDFWKAEMGRTVHSHPAGRTDGDALPVLGAEGARASHCTILFLSYCS